MGAAPIRLLISDVDGTLIRSDKSLSEASIAAVRSLHEAGIEFALTSGRPPYGLTMYQEPLGLTTPLAGFNGGLILAPDRTQVAAQTVPDTLVPGVLDLFARFDVDAWIFRGSDWFLTDATTTRAQHEERTIGYGPTVVDSLLPFATGVEKLLGVSDDAEAVMAANHAVNEAYGDQLSAARSQPYYLDVTSPKATKGFVVDWMAEEFGISRDSIAVIGDQLNDIPMFERAGLAIAMGNGDPAAKASAHEVTAANDDDGFAAAVREWILPRAAR